MVILNLDPAKMIPLEIEDQTPEKILENCIENLGKLKTGWKDGIPDEIKHSTSKDCGWKVQKGSWFQVASSTITQSIREHHFKRIILPNELFEELKRYNEVLTKTMPKKELTKQEDINKMEAMIDKLLMELKKIQFRQSISANLTEITT